MTEDRKRWEQMPVADAKRRVLPHLSDPLVFRCVIKPLTGPLPQPLSLLAPELRELFGRFRSIELVGGETMLDRDQVVPSPHFRPLIHIGTDFSLTELLVEAGDERVYILSEYPEPGEDIKRDSFPSIYHYLLRELDELPGGERDAQ